MNDPFASRSLRQRPVGQDKDSGAHGRPFSNGSPKPKLKHGEIKRIARAPFAGVLRVVSGLVSLFGLWTTIDALWSVSSLARNSEANLRPSLAESRTATLGYTVSMLCIALDRNLATMLLVRCGALQGRCNSRSNGTRRYAVFALKTVINMVMLPLVYMILVGNEWLRTVVYEPLEQAVTSQNLIVETLTIGVCLAATSILFLELSRKFGLDPQRGKAKKLKLGDDQEEEDEDDFVVSSTSGPWNPTEINYGSSLYSLVLLLCKFVHTCVVTPFAEELFYRVFIVSRVAKIHIHVAHMDLSLDGGEGHWMIPVFVGALLFGCGERNYALGPIAGILWGLAQSLVLRRHGIAAAMFAHAVRNACTGIYVIARKEWVLWSPPI